MKKILYTAQVTTKGGRNGQSESSDGTLKLKLAVPKEMGGQGGGTNPEQLFATGYSACFGSALELAATQHNIPVKDIQVTAHVSIGPREKEGFELAVDLDVRLPGVSKSDAETLVAHAHRLCPYSWSIRNNIDVHTKVLD